MMVGGGMRRSMGRKGRTNTGDNGGDDDDDGGWWDETEHGTEGTYKHG